jgi:hypothetical protein
MTNGQTAAAPVPPLSTVSNGEGRTANGQFGKGNRFGRGNPFFRRLAQHRVEVVCEITPDELRALMRRLYGQAMSGDTAAAVVLLGYLLGKPGKVVDPDAVDDDQWKRMRDVPSRAEYAATRMCGVPTDTAIGRLQQFRENNDPFATGLQPEGEFILDEIKQQRKRRK